MAFAGPQLYIVSQFPQLSMTRTTKTGKKRTAFLILSFLLSPPKQNAAGQRTQRTQRERPWLLLFKRETMRGLCTLWNM